MQIIQILLDKLSTKVFWNYNLCCFR